MDGKMEKEEEGKGKRRRGTGRSENIFISVSFPKIITK